MVWYHREVVPYGGFLTFGVHLEDFEIVTDYDKSVMVNRDSWRLWFGVEPWCSGFEPCSTFMRFSPYGDRYWTR